MQNVDSAERFNEFEQAVINVAEAQAKSIIESAEKERKDMLHKARHSVEKADYDKLTFAAERWRFGIKASMNQDSRRRLLTYRESLITELFKELDERLAKFTKTDGYKALMQTRLDRHKQAIDKDAVLYCTASDEAMCKAMCQGLAVQVMASDEIRIGGFRLGCGRVMYDETLDAAREDQREQLLLYCDLRVV